MGGKNQAPPPPDYGPIAAADAKAAEIAAATAEKGFKLSADQLQWGKDQFNTVWPYAQKYMQEQMDTNTEARTNAKEAQSFYETNYRPMERDLIDTANNYNSPTRANEQAGAAIGDVATKFQQQRTSALQTLESYGIDPSQTRFGALDLGTRISQAAASAAAGTQSRRNTEATGLALKGEAINIGKGYPGQVATSYGTATTAGSSGLGGANQAINTGVNAQGSPNSYFSSGAGAIGTQVAALSGQAQALNLGYNNALAGQEFNAKQNANFMQGIGQLAGGALGFFMGG